MNERKLEKAMRARVKEMKSFYTHLVIYIVVNLALLGAWGLSRTHFPWFLIVMGGWGIGLFFHWYNVFVDKGMLGKDWEDRKVKALMEKEKKLR